MVYDLGNIPCEGSSHACGNVQTRLHKLRGEDSLAPHRHWCVRYQRANFVYSICNHRGISEINFFTSFSSLTPERQNQSFYSLQYQSACPPTTTDAGSRIPTVNGHSSAIRVAESRIPFNSFPATDSFLSRNKTCHLPSALNSADYVFRFESMN